MDRLNALLRWTRSAVFRREADAQMEEELRFHLEMEIEHNIRSGMSRAEARRRALLSFGGLERHRERLREGRRAVACCRPLARALSIEPSEALREG